MKNDWSVLLLGLCQQVGADMMATYEQHLTSPMSVTRKSNNTPLTAADLAAHNALVEGLAKIDKTIPVLSEESSQSDIEQCKTWTRFWLIDPLDGTKEFLDGSGEFCMCIALVENSKPVFGFIYAPVAQTAWWGGVGVEATKFSKGYAQSISCSAAPITVVASWRGFDRKDVTALVKQLNCPTLTMGSALKFCLIAEGKAQIYPSLGPTSEWDSGAGQAIVEAAGGVVLNQQGHSLTYNRRDAFLNPPFYALANKSLLPAKD